MPYQAIHAAPLNAGREASTPFLNARAQACRLCRDFPCAAACPTGALEMPAERKAAAMGVAVINEDTCLSFQGMRCEVCYRACPLIDEAIRIDYRPREGDDIHAVFAPQVIPRCAGCGLCEQRCRWRPCRHCGGAPGADAAAYTARRNGEA
ncbi:MAG: 4Fe-4S dicluster domain-containing protein [Adlercreutzia equolifaciens]